MDCIIDVIIPVFNEQESISKVIKEIPKNQVRNIIICDNGSTDQTSTVASRLGCIVVSEKNKGYGNACLKGMDYVSELEIKPDIIVFLDGDYSDYPEELNSLVDPIINNDVDLVIGSRALGKMESGVWGSGVCSWYRSIHSV